MVHQSLTRLALPLLTRHRLQPVQLGGKTRPAELLSTVNPDMHVRLRIGSRMEAKAPIGHACTFRMYTRTDARHFMRLLGQASHELSCLLYWY